MTRPCRAAIIVVLLGSVAMGQTQLNTTVRSFQAVPGNPWVADIWSYTDSMGRDFALVCQGNIGLSCYEITNPAAPVFASSIAATASDLKDVKVYQDHAYCVQQGGPTLAVSLADPYNMQVVDSFGECGHNATIDHQQGLFIQTRNGCSPFDARIYSLANPSNPVFLASYSVGNGFNSHDAYAQDGLLYVSVLFGGTAGTDIVDISNPSNPQFINKVPTGNVSHAVWLYNAPGGQKVLCSTNETQGGHLLIYDVTDPMDTPFLSEYITDPGISIHNPVVVGRYCFLSYYADYLRIVDLANPSDPQEVGIYDPTPSNAGQGTFDGAWGVAYVKPLGNNAHRVLITESFNSPLGFWVVDFDPGPVVELDLSTSGNGDLSMTVSGADPNSAMFNPFSLTTTSNLGAGPVVGLQGDAIFTLTVPPGTPPFAVSADGTGTYSLNLPAATIPPGISADVASIALVGGVQQVSPLGRINF